jgi:hypothetical protein
MDYRVEALHPNRLRLAVRKQMDVPGIFQPGNEPILGIVISENQIDPDPGILQATHAVNEVEACPVITPLAIE